MRQLFAVLYFLLIAGTGFAEGWLEVVEGQQVLHLSGTPYEIGYRHGELLKEQIARNVALFMGQPKGASEDPAIAERVAAFRQQMVNVLPFIPSRFMEEMRGLADGSGIPYEKILFVNLLPELFHCSGITVQDRATQDGTLYHVRVLDYAKGKSLQATAVLLVVEPEGGIPFLNVSYAGFIGSVTGMNAQKIAIGEIGGGGYGQWLGMPMSFLLRDLLERASTLEEAEALLTAQPRTCEYFYVISDGKSKASIGFYATDRQLLPLLPATAYHLPDGNRYVQLEDCLIVAGLNKSRKFEEISRRLQASYGRLDLEGLKEAIKRPIAADSNLHNAIFVPEKLQVWISHAGPNDEPACDQPYHAFSLETLLRQP